MSTYCIQRTFHTTPLNLHIIYREHLTRHPYVYLIYTENISHDTLKSTYFIQIQSHPEYLSLQGFTAIVQDVQKFRRKILLSKLREKKLRKSWSIDDLLDKYLTFNLWYTLYLLTKKIRNTMTVHMFVVNVCYW